MVAIIVVIWKSHIATYKEMSKVFSTYASGLKSLYVCHSRGSKQHKTKPMPEMIIIAFTKCLFL